MSSSWTLADSFAHRAMKHAGRPVVDAHAQARTPRALGRHDGTPRRIPAREIDGAPRMHPAVDDVRATGIPDEMVGEPRRARAVPVEGAALAAGELLEELARDPMADHRIPDLARRFDAVPLTGPGTVKRRALEHRRVLEATSP